MFARKIIQKIRQFSFKLLYLFASNNYRVKLLRYQGVKIGEGCEVHAKDFSTEPYLIEIGDHVALASGTEFVTHDGSVWIVEGKYPKIDLFGTIKIGSNTHIGLNATILPNTIIGENCVIGAGSVVRGVIPDNSVVFGNPAKVIMKSSIAQTLFLHHKHRLDTKGLPAKEKERIIREHFNIAEGAAKS